jgi:hypothetical protein
MLMAKPGTDDWVNGVTPDDVRKMIERTFAFLVSDHSFREPVDCSINTMVIALSYAGNTLSIEPHVDRRDCFVETCIVRLESGSRPEGWKIDEEGQQFMQRLFEAAWDRDVKRADTKHSSNSPEEKLQSLLDAEVAMLRQSFPDFLADDGSYFKELNLRRSAEAAIKAENDFFAVAEELFKTKDFAGLTARLSSTSYTLSKLWQARLAYARKNA